MKLLDVVAHVRALTDDAPYAVVGGLAQILWARKTHTDDLHVALMSPAVDAAARQVLAGLAPAEWAAPSPPDVCREADDVFEVAHLLCHGAVVDLLAFRDEEFQREILSTARPVPELGGVRFISPELLLVTQLLRPGPNAALAALELVLARTALPPFDLAYVRRWARRVDREAGLDRTLQRASTFT